MITFKSYSDSNKFIDKHYILNAIYDFYITGRNTNETTLVYDLHTKNCTESIFFLSLMQVLIMMIFIAGGSYFLYGYLLMTILMVVFICFNFVLSVLTYKFGCRYIGTYLIHAGITFFCIICLVEAYENYVDVQKFKNICVSTYGETNETVIMNAYREYRRQYSSQKDIDKRTKKLINDMGIKTD